MNARSLLPVALLLILLALPAVPFALADFQPQEPPGGNVRYPPTDLVELSFNAEDVTAYWTPERLAAAQPMPFYYRDELPIDAPYAVTQEDGPAQRVAGNNIGGPEGTVINATFQGLTGADTPNFTYPFAFNETFMAIPIASSTYGKLYYTQLGSDYVCSGTSATSGGSGQSLVLTAAHCLHAGNNDPGGWSTNILFIPGKLGASEPYGSWTAYSLWVTTNYMQTGNWREDYGFIVTNPQSNACGRLGVCVGSQGLAWNQSVNELFWATGYPEAPFTGTTLIICYAQMARLDSAPGTGPLTMGIGCDMTGGSSGGGWVVGGKIANKGWLDSVNSYKYLSEPNAIYGPYFDTSLYDLWQSARLDLPPAP